jgi:hypothetical protein
MQSIGCATINWGLLEACNWALDFQILALGRQGEHDSYLFQHVYRFGGIGDIRIVGVAGVPVSGSVRNPTQTVSKGN